MIDLIVKIEVHLLNLKFINNLYKNLNQFKFNQIQKVNLVKFNSLKNRLLIINN